MNAELPFVRECDRPDCKNTCTPTGDGSTPFLSTDSGGKYFCSDACRSIFASTPLTIKQELENALRTIDVPNPILVAHLLVQNLQPTIEELPTGNPDVRTFKISTPPLASLMSCMLSADQNYPIHVGENGVTQTLVRIGDFAGVISRVAPDALLAEIKRVKLLQQVPLGTTVFITATKKSVRADITHFLVTSHLEDGTPLSKPTTVVTVNASK